MSERVKSVISRCSPASWSAGRYLFGGRTVLRNVRNLRYQRMTPFSREEKTAHCCFVMHIVCPLRDLFGGGICFSGLEFDVIIVEKSDQSQCLASIFFRKLFH